VLLKPAPSDVVDAYFQSLAAMGLDPLGHDLRLVEDDWESPTLGAAGLGRAIMEHSEWLVLLAFLPLLGIRRSSGSDAPR
jgi:glycyl-tRNA synthetase alpha subunit